MLKKTIRSFLSVRYVSPFCQAPFASLPPPPAAVGFPSARFFRLSSSLQNGRTARFRSHFSLLLSALRLPPSASGGGRLRAHRGTAVSLVSLLLSQKTSCVFCETRRSKAACGWFCFFPKKQNRSKANFAPTWLPLLDSNQRSSLQNGRTARYRSHSSLLPSALRLPPSATGGGRLRAPAEPQCRWLFLSKHKRDAIFDVSFLAPPVGLEPTTLRLTAACSTN